MVIFERTNYGIELQAAVFVAGRRHGVRMRAGNPMGARVRGSVRQRARMAAALHRKLRGVR